MGDGAINDFLSHYKYISNKLKKRFLRKPNVAESSEHFALGQCLLSLQTALLCEVKVRGCASRLVCRPFPVPGSRTPPLTLDCFLCCSRALGVQCEHDELPQYAGLCYLAVARCEASLNNPSGEAWALIKAGRKFIHAHAQAEANSLVAPASEHLEAGLSSLTQAGLLWPSEPEKFLAAGLAMETGNVLAYRHHQAAISYQRAATLLAGHPSLQLHALYRLANCRMQMGDLNGALSVLSQTVQVVGTIAKLPSGIYADIMLSCEISRVLLLLLLRPPPQLLPPHLTAVLEKYSWLGDATDSPDPWLSEDMLMYLQSLVMSCQAQDEEGLLSAEAYLWPHLDWNQQQLLQCLVHSFTDN